MDSVNLICLNFQSCFIEILFRDCNIEGIEDITHDTKLYSIRLPTNVYYEVPIGHHVIVKCEVEGKKLY